LDWRAKVELFEQIRREYEFGIGTIAGVAKKLGVHRRMVREAIVSALPKPRRKTERPRWKLRAAVDFVDTVLEADRKAPRKQRHTAHRIWERIQHELPDCKIGELSAVRQYVHRRKIALGLTVHETYVPQSYAWGVEAQVDWYEAYADLAGERIKLQVFAMRSMAGGVAFHCTHRRHYKTAFAFCSRCPDLFIALVCLLRALLPPVLNKPVGLNLNHLIPLSCDEPYSRYRRILVGLQLEAEPGSWVSGNCSNGATLLSA
jgi:hypothetical protein